MAKINVNDNIEGEIGGAGFTQQGTAIANTLAPDIAVALADTAKGLYVESKKAEAVTESKSLLDEFTGREHTVFAEEGEVDDPIAESPDVQEVPQTTAATEQIEGLKKQLAHERKAVAQGLMSNDEFRLRAEQSFYQITALTPGIKSEIAAVMGEYLGIDPRGQTAQITMRDRDNAAAADAARNKQLVSALITERMYDPGLSDEENISKNWPIIQKSALAMKNIDMEMKRIALWTAETTQDKQIAANNFRAWIPEAERTALNLMGVYKGTNILDLTPQEVINIDPETRAAWAHSASLQAGSLTQVLNSVETSTGENFATNRDTVDDHLELVLSILKSEQLNDALTTNLSVAQTRSDLLVKAAGLNIAMTQPEAVTLAAYNDIGINTANMLGVNVEATRIVLQGLKGDIPNLSSADPKDKATVIERYTGTLRDVANSYAKTPKDYTDADIGNAGNVALMVANQDPAVLNSIKPSLQLFKLVAKTDFMTRLEKVDPEKARALKQGVVKHMEAVGYNYNKEISTVYQNTGAEQLDAMDCHIEKVEDTWLVVPNSDVDAKLAPNSASPHSRSQALSKKDAGVVDAKRSALVASLNRTPKMIPNMVNCVVAITGLPPSEAAKQVAQDLGISVTDVLPSARPEGHPRGRYRNYEVVEDAPRTTPATLSPRAQALHEGKDKGSKSDDTPKMTKVEDGTYEINGSLYQIKDGRIIPIE